MALGAAEVYRWTDANGQTHYSDRPRPGAERVTIAVSAPASPPLPASESPESDTAPEEELPAPVVRYESLTVTSPGQEEVLWNIEGQLAVEAAVDPELQPEHTLRFYLDERVTPTDPGSLQARFSEVFRGEHTLRVEVVDQAGQPLIASPTTRFYVRQTAIPNPVPPPRPQPRAQP